MMREEVVAGIPLVAREVLQHLRVHNAGAWCKRLAPPRRANPLVHIQRAHRHGCSISATHGQGYPLGSQAEERHPSRIGTEVLQAHEQVNWFAFEKRRLTHLGAEYELLRQPADRARDGEPGSKE